MALGYTKSVIPNFRQVNDWLYRGGQPGDADFNELLELGVKTIISLRWSSEILRDEREQAASLGLNYFAIPLSYVFFPTRHEIAKFLKILDNQALHSIFVHCKYGADRTGMMIAFYRMEREGWSAPRAYAEMKACGYHSVLVRHFKYAVLGYERRLQRRSRLNSK